ncbi:MAG TPA: queuosine salvage family protein [Solirubrobacteraceae bacterium]|nr:queuosine salvage family protein [Solirubrobacteraceae bacterium]
MTIDREVRRFCERIARDAEHVRIDLDVIADIVPAEPPAPDGERHFLEGSPADVADYVLALDAINFGSGWFPTLRKRLAHGEPVSGYFTIAWNLTDHVRTHGPPTSRWLAQVTSVEIAAILGQDPGNELMSLYAQALRELGRFLAGPPARRALDLVDHAGGSAVRLADLVSSGMRMWADRGFYKKRAQILAADLAMAGVAEFEDLDRLTIFADNLVPHVLRCDGVLVYDDALAARIDAGQRLQLGGAEREIRACALHTCTLISQRTGIAEREIDNWLWTRGQAPEYKSRPRHRCRTVFY